MAVEGTSPILAIRCSEGVEFWQSKDLKCNFELKMNLPREESKHCRVITFGSDGRYFALSNGNAVKIYRTKNWQLICSLPRPKASHIKFSPRGNFIVTWELLTVAKDKNGTSPNFFVYDANTGNEVFKQILKKQSDWEPCWSIDESLFALMIGGEACFYEIKENNGFHAIAYKVGSNPKGSVSIAPGQCPPHIAFYMPGTEGVPSMCKVYRYPFLHQNQAVTSKSFFQADRVEMLWNNRGTGLILLTSTEVDQTGASYYGKQALHFMSTKGDSFAIQLGKEGAIHSVTWSPRSTEFVVVYGYMPAKATLYNLKCDVIFEFGESSRNCCFFNDFGNLLILAGFGNLRGYVEIWDMNKKTKISSLQAPDTTLLEWNPSGEIFVTATTSPRLRISNGFKIWHYSGALLFETFWPQGQELLEVLWQKFPLGTYKERPITNIKMPGIKTSQPEASKQVYQPPNLRLIMNGKDKSNTNEQQLPLIPGLPPGYLNRNTRPVKKWKKKKEIKSSEPLQELDTGSNKKLVGSPEKKSCKKDLTQTDGDFGAIGHKTKYTRKPDNASALSPADEDRCQKMCKNDKQQQNVDQVKFAKFKCKYLHSKQLADPVKQAILSKELADLKLEE